MASMLAQVPLACLVFAAMLDLFNVQAQDMTPLVWLATLTAVLTADVLGAVAVFVIISLRSRAWNLGALPRTLGIVAFVVAIFFNVIGLILGIVALVQSRKAGVKNGWAVAAIIVGAVLAVVGIIVGIILVAVFANAAGDLIQFCANNPSGVYELNGQTVTCNGG